MPGACSQAGAYEAAAGSTCRGGARTLSVDELLAARLTPPPGVGPVSLQDMDEALAGGASGSRNANAASLLGLMADEPDLVDQVCSLAYEGRRTAHLRAVDE